MKTRKEYPRVSIVMAAYNAAETIGEALHSLQRQSYPLWEAVIVDDGSADATAAIASTFQRRDERFRVISQENRGVSEARNRGIAASEHPWVLFLDADDWMTRRGLERLVAAIRSDETADAAYGGWWYVTSDGYEAFGATPWKSGHLFEMHARSCPYALHAYLLRKSLVQRVGGFDPQLVTCEDWDLWQKLSRIGTQFRAVPYRVAPYRLRPASASLNGRQMFEDALRVLDTAYGKDSRLPNSAFPNGMTTWDLDMRRHYVLCTAAGLAYGAGNDGSLLVDKLPSGTPWVRLDAYFAADCFVQSLLIAAARPLREWSDVWKRLETTAQTFFFALEKKMERPGFCDEAMMYARLLVPRYTSPAGVRHRLRAAANRTRIRLVRKQRSTSAAFRLSVSATRATIKTTLSHFPRIAALARRMHQPLVQVDTREVFETLFEKEVDPWDYTNTYEQLKYEQTLGLLPEGDIEDALELACAEGHFTVQFAPRVKRLLATDISEKAVARTAERCRGHDNIRYRQLDFVKDEIGGTYDVVVCSESLYYAGTRTGLARIARKLAAAVKPGGHLIMAHGNVVVDDPDAPGFGWEHHYGGKGIGETFSQVNELLFLKEIRTPLYRIQLFQRDAASRTVAKTLGEPKVAAQIIHAPMASPLPEAVNEQILWSGMDRKLPILMYHRVAPFGSPALRQWRVTPEDFEAQLGLLRERGYYSASFEQWRAYTDHREPMPKGGVLITFDDGYADFAEHAWPLLKKYGFTATVFVVSKEVGRFNAWDSAHGESIPLLTWQQIRQLQADGLDIGSHTRRHPMLTKMPLGTLVRELRGSRLDLEDALGRSIRSIAYPYGESSPVVQFLAGAAGYEFGVTVDEGFARKGRSMLALPRIEIEGGDSLRTFAAKLGIEAGERHIASAA